MLYARPFVIVNKNILSVRRLVMTLSLAGLCSCKADLDDDSQVDWFASMRAASFSPVDRAGSGILTLLHSASALASDRLNATTPRTDHANFRLETFVLLQSLHEDALTDDFQRIDASIDDVLDLILPNVISVDANDAKTHVKVGGDTLDKAYEAVTGLKMTDGLANAAPANELFPYVETISP